MHEEEPLPARERLHRGGVDLIQDCAALAAAISAWIFARVAQGGFEGRPHCSARTPGAVGAGFAELHHHKGAAAEDAIRLAVERDEGALPAEQAVRST